MRSLALGLTLCAALLASCDDASDDPREDEIAGVMAQADEPVLRTRRELTAGKYVRMVEAPIDFLRGSVPIYRHDSRAGTSLASVSDFAMDLPLVPSIGDPHIENFGALRASDGSLALEPNDFDAADQAPYLWDLRRLASSMVIAATTSNSEDPPQRILATAAARDIAHAVTTDDGAVLTDGSIPTKDGALAFGDSSVLLNEISANEEWIEVVATGSGITDLTGYRVADSEKDGGGPKLDEAATFPAGTVLSPKAYAIVQGGGIDAGVGKPCPDGGQSFCVNAEFGVSNKSGETNYLVDPKGVIVGTAVYPPKAAADGETWGRIPNADPAGAFVVTTPTPGAANAAP